jgi:hypothetical protein
MARQLRIGGRQAGTGTVNANSSSCRCAKCGGHKPAAPAVASTPPAPVSVTTPVTIDQARDLLHNVRALQDTPANRGLMRLLLTAFPTLSDELAATPAPKMPSMAEAIRSARQPQTSTVAPARRTMRELSSTSKPTAPVPDAPERLAACKVPSMSERILNNRKK